MYRFILGICLILFAVFLIAIKQARASDWWLVIPSTSWHESKKPYNEDNWGLGFEYVTSPSWSFVGGTYPNSFKERTFYLGGVYAPAFLQLQTREILFKPGILAGYFTGYEHGRAIPIVSPSLQIEIEKKIGIGVLFGCDNFKCKDGFIGFSLKFNKGIME
jgi:hypothetical protein